MIKRYLSGYHDFKCIADKCPASCCSGWAIEIDEESLSRYTKSDFSDCIDWQESIFKQKSNGDCVFLREDGLCHMQAAYGEEFLCRTCDLYPRHIEEFPDVEEYSLSASCPVAAKMLLEQQEALSFKEDAVCSKQEDTSDYEDFQYDLYEALLSCRENGLKIMTDRTYPYLVRSQIFLKTMREVQASIDEGEAVHPENIFNRNVQSVSEHVTSCHSSENPSDSFDCHFSCTPNLFSEHEPSALLDLLFELEPLRVEFRTFLEDMESEMPLDSDFIANLESEFRHVHPDVERYLENISVYFLSTYMCGAVYDDYVYSMSCMAIYNAYMILLLWMGKWYMDLKKERSLSLEELCEILYSYCRELEHSNENMILLEELLDQL